jgi:hypothetical protein
MACDGGSLLRRLDAEADGDRQLVWRLILATCAATVSSVADMVR